MAYTDHFQAADDLVAHLNTVVPNISDPLLRAKYIGFLGISVVTVFELCVREVLIEFARKKNKHFGVYCSSVFDRLNGRVTLKDLREVHIKPFGDKYVSRFNSKLDTLEKASLTAGNGSVKASYGNVITWRHSFAHQGVLPANASYAETTKGFVAGKSVMSCLAQAMVR